MTYNEFIREVRERRPIKRTPSKDYPLSLSDINEITKIIFETIVDLVAYGEEVNIDNFGKFCATKLNDRIGTHPATHERITVKGRIKPKFIPFKNFKDEVNF